MPDKRLSLSDSRQTDSLDEFIKQEEARGVGPIDEAELTAAIAKLVKPPQSEDQTSRSPSSGDSTER